MGEEIFFPEIHEPGSKQALQRGEGIDLPNMIPSMNVPETPMGDFENPNTIKTYPDPDEVHEI